MLSNAIRFENDKNAILIRNHEMHKHYNQLNSIKNRKNIYLPNIPSKNGTSRNTLIIPGSQASEAKLLAEKDNKILFGKIQEIKHRANQAIKDDELISKYLRIKKNTRDNVRKIKTDLLVKTNEGIKQRIKNVKPVINPIKMLRDFSDSRKYCNNLRKIHPSMSASDIYITKDESYLVQKYNNEKNDCFCNGNGNPSLNSPVKLNKIITYKLGYSPIKK